MWNTKCFGLAVWQGKSTCTVWAHGLMPAHASIAFAMQHAFFHLHLYGVIVVMLWSPLVKGSLFLLVLPHSIWHSIARMQFCQGKCLDGKKAWVLVWQQGQKLTTIKDLRGACYQHNISSGNGADWILAEKLGFTWLKSSGVKCGHMAKAMACIFVGQILGVRQCSG